VFTELNFHAVARPQPDPISFRYPGSMGQNLRFITQLQPEYQTGQFFQNYGFHGHALA